MLITSEIRRIYYLGSLRYIVMKHGAEDDSTLPSELWIDLRAGKKGMEETLV